MKSVRWLILVGLLFGCGGEATPTATAVPPQLPTAETVAAAEVIPTATAVSVPHTAIPPTPQPPVRLPVPTPAPLIVPALVWLPYGSGSYGQPVLMVQNDDMELREMPVEVELFFDYEAGWLAYGSTFWEATADQQSVTDLHMYNFATGTDQLWAEGNIGRAALSPINEVSSQPSVAIAAHDGSGFDLVVMLGPDNSVPLVEDVDPYFVWSPDGDWIAYLKDGDLFITSAAVDSGNPPIASGVYQNSGWIGDAPLWLGDSGYLLYADAPFTIVAVDGSETIVPTAADGTALQGQRPYTMLYSSTTHQLVAEFEGMFGTNVMVYQFGDGFATAVPLQQIDDAQLAGWYVENESVVIVSGGEPTMGARKYC